MDGVEIIRSLRKIEQTDLMLSPVFVWDHFSALKGIAYKYRQILLTNKNKPKFTPLVQPNYHDLFHFTFLVCVRMQFYHIALPNLSSIL